MKKIFILTLLLCLPVVSAGGFDLITGNFAASIGKIFTVCPEPYHVWDGNTMTCQWSCGLGTIPDYNTFACLCKDGYVKIGTDQFDRIVCVDPSYTSCIKSNRGIEACDGIDNNCNGQVDEACEECQVDYDCDDSNICTTETCKNSRCLYKKITCPKSTDSCIVSKCIMKKGCVSENICKNMPQVLQSVTLESEPNVKTSQHHVTISWSITGNPPIEFSYGKSRAYDSNQFTAINHVELGHKYKIDANTLYYYRIKAGDLTYESVFKTEPEYCSDIVAQVCADGETYTNKCLAEAAQADIQCEHACPCDQECKDEDNGNYFIRGVAKGRYSGSYIIQEDTCDGNQLIEYRCGYQNDPTGFGYITKEKVQCDYGCDKGACRVAQKSTNIATRPDV